MYDKTLTRRRPHDRIRDSRVPNMTQCKPNCRPRILAEVRKDVMAVLPLGSRAVHLVRGAQPLRTLPEQSSIRFGKLKDVLAVYLFNCATALRQDQMQGREGKPLRGEASFRRACMHMPKRSIKQARCTTRRDICGSYMCTWAS